MSDPIFKVGNLSKSFGGVDALKDVSFALARGELLALIGPNGAGKTTCFNILNGYQKPDQGSVKLHGRELVGLPPRKIWRMGIGRTFQITQTFLSMTALENVQMALLSRYRRLFGLMSRAARQYSDEATGLLDMVLLAPQAHRPCSELAYGDLKRLELAIALASEADVLLMDEPTAGMPPAERLSLMDLTVRIAGERRLGVLFTEHDMDVVFSHADRILVLNRGELIAEGKGDDIRKDPLVRDVYLGGGTVFGNAMTEKAHA